MTSPTKTKYWCFTINNPHPTKDILMTESQIEYMIIGQEKGGETGTPHLQGFVAFYDRKYMTGVSKLMPRAHLEAKRGTIKEAVDYCKKEGYYQEIGVMPEEQHVAGGRVRKRQWEEAKQLAIAGDLDAIPADIYIPYYSSCKRIKQDHPRKFQSLPEVCGIWIVGPPKTGKSETVRTTYEIIYDKPANKWWDGYNYEPNVLIDDFDKVHKVLGHYLKRWADKYSFPAEMKGTTVPIRPEKIIVTSNYHIEEIFDDDLVLQEAILRRFNVINFVKTSLGFFNVIPINT